MGYDADDLRELFRLAGAELLRREDQRDFNAELAGLDTGRTARFHSAAFVEDRQQGRSGTSSSGKDKQREKLSRLQMLLASNPAYMRAYEGTFKSLRDAESHADDALAELLAAHAKAQRELHDMRERAARLPDGRRVFRDENGQVWDEQGTPVNDADAATIEWRGNEPTREEFEGQRTYTDKLARGIDEVRGIQVDLGEIHEEMTDQDNPPTKERVDELHERVEHYEQQTQDILARASQKEPARQAVEVQPERTAQLDIPTL